MWYNFGMKNNKGFAPILIVLIVVAVLAIGGGAYYLKTKNEAAVTKQEQNQAVPLPSQSASSSQELVGWKTYHNDQYGFEFQYPRGFQVKQCVSYATGTLDLSIYPNGDMDICALSSRALLIAGDFPEIELDILRVSSKQVQAEEDELGYNIKLGKIIAEKIQDSQISIYYGATSLGTAASSFFYNDKLMVYAKTWHVSKTTNNFMKQILSTFKFTSSTPQVDTSNWKTYRNEKYGFEFKYPPNFSVEPTTFFASASGTTPSDVATSFRIYNTAYKHFVGEVGADVRAGEKEIDFIVYKFSNARMTQEMNDIEKEVGKPPIKESHPFQVDGQTVPTYYVSSPVGPILYAVFTNSQDIFSVSSEFGPMEGILSNFKFTSTTFTWTENASTTHISSGNGFTLNTHLSGTVTKTVDCGSKDCFNTKFASCEPATLETDAGSIAFRSHIVAPATGPFGGCRVDMLYPENPNPDWVGKDMTCTLDNKLDFDSAMSKLFDGITQVANGGKSTVLCSGPLYTIMITPSTSYHATSTSQPTPPQTSTLSPKCSDLTCFDKAFASCSAATYVDVSEAGGTFQDTIKGKITGGCTVNWKVLTSSFNNGFAGLDMDCTMNNSESFTQAKKDLNTQFMSGTATCKGTYFTALQILLNAGNH